MRLSPVVTSLLFIIVLVVLTGCATSNHITKESQKYKPYVIDINNFDPYDFFGRSRDEIEARKQSTTREFYLPGNIDIRLSLVAESDKEIEESSDVEAIKDFEGKQYFVAKKAELDLNDIETVYIEKSTYRGNEQYSIGLLFKKESWDKFYDATERLRGKRLALIKDKELLSAPVIHEAVIGSAVVDGNFTNADIERIIVGLMPTAPYPENERADLYIDWLENRVAAHIDDSQALTQLAWRYSEKKEQDCEKMTAIYEKVVRLDPNRYLEPFLRLLRTCFKEADTDVEAIAFYNGLLAENKAEELEQATIRMDLAQIYVKTGNLQKALDELERALTITKALHVSYPWLEKSACKGEIQNLLNFSKAQMIMLIEAAMERIKLQESINENN